MKGSGGRSIDERIQGMNPDWCVLCREPRGGLLPRTPVGIGGTKQDELVLLCDQHGIPRASIGVGSGVPAHAFEKFALDSDWGRPCPRSQSAPPSQLESRGRASPTVAGRSLVAARRSRLLDSLKLIRAVAILIASDR